LAVATLKNGVLLWDRSTRLEADKLPEPKQNYAVEEGKALACSNSGSLVAYLNKNNRVTIYDLAAKATVATLPSIEGKTLVLAFSPNDKLLATAGESKTVDLWDTSTGKPVYSLKGHFDTVRSICFFPTRPKLISLADDGTLRLWDISKFVER
jgi:WD40 repeat protein